jgi:hypothetical protein
MTEGQQSEPTPILEEVLAEIRATESICQSFLNGLRFVVQDTARDPEYLNNHLLSYTFQDYLQSIVALPLLIQAGIHNVCRRELRFILEMSIKLCVVQQQKYQSDVATKLSTLKSTLDSTNISMQKSVDLFLLPSDQYDDFHQEVGRVYGETSNYVHLTSKQILERIDLVTNGRTSGFENAVDIQSLNGLIARGLACSLVFLLHSVPDYVAGDLLVENDGASFRWFFSGSRFIAHIDEKFDYKHERQARLEEIKTQRWQTAFF